MVAFTILRARGVFQAYIAANWMAARNILLADSFYDSQGNDQGGPIFQAQACCPSMHTRFEGLLVREKVVNLANSSLVTAATNTYP